MIKFVPKLRGVQSVLTDSENYVHNISNKSLASQCNDRFGGKGCPKHPDFENTLEVDLANEGRFIEIVSYCCDEFKPTLELIADNKDPYSAQ